MPAWSARVTAETGWRQEEPMELFDAISGRRSVRDFTAERVDDSLIARVLKAAVDAASARNGQPWRFTVVRDGGLIDRLSDEAKAFQLSMLPDVQANEARRARMADPATHLLHHAPALVLISAAEPSTWATEDCALAAQNLMLAAWALGLGSCYIGNVQAYLNTPAGKRLLGLAEDCVPVAPIVVGHPASLDDRPARNEPIVSWID